jgi:hypothetical protein
VPSISMMGAQNDDVRGDRGRGDGDGDDDEFEHGGCSFHERGSVGWLWQGGAADVIGTRVPVPGHGRPPKEA